MSIKNVLNKTPLRISAAIMLVINFLLIQGIIELKADSVAAFNSALFSVLLLFVANKTANKAVLNEMAQDPDQEYS